MMLDNVYDLIFPRVKEYSVALSIIISKFERKWNYLLSKDKYAFVEIINCLSKILLLFMCLTKSW